MALFLSHRDGRFAFRCVNDRGINRVGIRVNDLTAWSPCGRDVSVDMTTTGDEVQLLLETVEYKGGV